MKNIMKLLSVLLCLTIALSCFTGCGKNTDENKEQQGDKTNNADTEMLTFGDEREVMIDDEIVSLPVLSIKIDEKTISFPCTVKEFAEQSGCTFDLTTNLQDKMEPDMRSELVTYFNDGYAKMYLHNSSSSSIAIEDCLINLMEYSDDYWNSVEIPLGFSLKSDITIEDIKAELGEPTKIEENHFGDCTIYYYKETDLGLSMYAFNFQENILANCQIGCGTKEE